MDDRPPPDTPQDVDEEKWPLGFLVIITLAALYLGWRLIQGIMWVASRF